ncbi:hypothetical protein [Kordia sp.]|uniref:hypothetical protein n=1 Tax=Kordia sp. TaxID=1965332 RepID=UPI0025C4384E|nr:hypothetical protein [Kordia sp.]MCH2195344.1 hypothetical protein [Kordia sp.]
MKKKNLKSLSLNKKSISDLSTSIFGGNESFDNSCIASCHTFTCPPATMPTQCHTCQYHTKCGPGECISKPRV